MASEGKWQHVVNLSNSIIGVSILTMPFCMKQCGVILGCLLLLGTNLLTRLTCYLLIKGAYESRTRSLEFYGFQVFGRIGKKSIEIVMVSFLLSTLVAFFVVIGDLGPDILSQLLNTSVSASLRIGCMMFIAAFIILPLSLLRDASSLSAISSMAILFYFFFTVRVFFLALPNLLTPMQTYDSGSYSFAFFGHLCRFFRLFLRPKGTMEIWKSSSNVARLIKMWDLGGLLRCLPIFALSLSCQPQLFSLSSDDSEMNPSRMDGVVAGAVNLCSGVYFLVSFFNLYLWVGVLGYCAFVDDKSLAGDILILFENSLLTELIKLAFLLSVAVSFPLMIFPCRSAIYTALFRQGAVSSNVIDDSPPEFIPESPFRLITVSLVCFTVILAVIIPNVEFILGLTGSLIGSLLCIIMPGLLFLYVQSERPKSQFLLFSSQFCVVIGTFILVVCSLATLASEQQTVTEIKSAMLEETTTKLLAPIVPLTLKADLPVNEAVLSNVTIANAKVKRDDRSIIVSNNRTQAVKLPTSTIVVNSLNLTLQPELTLPIGAVYVADDDAVTVKTDDSVRRQDVKR